MNKVIKHLVFTIFLFSSLDAATVTQKTYLQTRPFLSNLPMEYTTWHTQVNKDKIGSWGGTFQATGFYQQSTNKKDLGEYFGYYATTERVIRDYIKLQLLSGTDLDALYSLDLIHYYDRTVANDDSASGSFSLNPKQKTFGIRLDYYQAISDFFLKISTPITHVRNSINPGIAGNLTVAAGGAGNGQTIMDFFKGNVEEIAGTNQQEKLQYAKIDGSQSKTGLGNIEIALGYNFFKNRGEHIKFGIDVTLPTSNDAKGEWLFEPITGNGGYWAIGGFVDSKFRLWKHKKVKIELLTAANLQYLFKNTEKRTLGIKNYTGLSSMILGHYRLAGESGRNTLFPAANILAQDVKIKPQIHFEGLLGLSVISNNFTFDLGYNLFYKDKENISQKQTWEDNKYALATPNYDSSGAAFDPTIGGDSLNNFGPINSENIDLEPARSPSAITHKLYGGFGYCFNDWNTPLMLGIGGAYEFLSGNTVLEGFELWLKAGLAF